MKILRTIAALLLITTAIFTTWAQELSPEYIELLNEADSLVKESQWEDAEIKYMDAMRRHPANPMNVLVMSNVGLMRYYAGRDSLALEMLNMAVDMAPASVVVRSNRAKVLTSLNRLDEAVEDFNRILELDSMIVEPRHLRCIINLKEGDVEKARADASFLERHFPDDAAAAETNAFILLAENNYACAIPYLTKLLKHQPTATNYGERALCYIMTDNLNEASSDLADAIRLDPANGELYLYRSMLNKKRFRPNEASEDAQRAISLGVDEQKVRKIGLK